MAVKIIYSLFFLILLTSTVLAASSRKKNKEGNFRLIIEDATFKAYQTDIFVYNVTVVNSTFDINFHIFKTFDPVFFVKLDVMRKGKAANVLKQSADYCNLMNPPSPLSIIIKVLIEKGSINDLSCPLKLGEHAIKGCDIPANRFIWSLPALPFKIFIDVTEKRSKQVLCKNTITGKVKHI